MHSTGQASAHAPQLMQASSSIKRLPSSTSLMQLTGQTSSQAPQDMQFSLSILYAISTPPFKINTFHKIHQLLPILLQNFFESFIY